MLRHRHELLDIFVYRNLRTKLYYKRDDFNFPIVNFPLRCSNIPAAPAHIPPNNPELVVPISISLMESCFYQSHHFECLTVATMIWLTAMEYLCHKWPRICTTCRKHFPVLSSFMTYHHVCNKINTTSATSGAGTAHPSGAPKFTPCY